MSGPDQLTPPPARKVHWWRKAGHFFWKCEWCGIVYERTSQRAIEFCALEDHPKWCPSPDPTRGT